MLTQFKKNKITAIKQILQNNMKTWIKTFLLFSFIFISCKNANEPILDEKVQLKKTVNIVTPGSLSSILTTKELNSINNLTITGTIDARDIRTIRDSMSMLDTLDISAVNIAAYKGTNGTFDTYWEYLANEFPSDAIPIHLSRLYLLLPNSITSIGEYAFINSYCIDNINIPNSVVSIGRCAFSWCGFDSITLPNSVKTIGYGAFNHCTQIKHIVIPNSVESIEGNAFNDCPDLLGITIGDNISSIGDYAFDQSLNLASIEISPDNTVYSSNNGILYNKNITQLIRCPQGKSGSITIPNSVITIQKEAFISCTKLTGITLGSSTNTIGYGAFYDCNSLINMNIGNAVTTLGDRIFGSCDSLKTVTLNNSINSLPNGTFKDCINLINVSIGNSIISIGDNAFMRCSKLTTLTIPATVNSMGICVFSDCKELKSLYMLSKIPIPVNNPNSVFDDTNFSNCNLYVPIGSKSTYKSTILWNKFINIIEI